MRMFLQFLRIYQCIHFLCKIKLESLIKEILRIRIPYKIVILCDLNVNYDVKANIKFKVGLSRLRTFLPN